MMEAYSQAGLPKPSMVRPCKITTIEARDAERLGQVPDALTAQVVSAVIRLLGR
jgi:mRNA interferase MazF